MTMMTAKRARFSAMRALPTNSGLMADPGEFTEDAFLGGGLRLRQPKSGHRAGHDAMLLAAATSARSGARGVGFGARARAACVTLVDMASEAESFASAALSPDSVDVVLRDPPFNDPSRHRSSPDKSR